MVVLVIHLLLEMCHRDGKVSELIGVDGAWDVDKINTTFLPVDASEILQIRISNRGDDDCLAWHPEESGQFTVRSAYRLAVNLRELELGGASSSISSDGQRKVWDAIWKCHVPHKVRTFAWKIATDSLPTNVNKQRRGLLQTGRCSLCGIEDEDAFHALSCQSIHQSSSALESEILAFKEGITKALQWTLLPLVVESDCSMVVSLMTSREFDRSQLAFVIQEAKCILDGDREIVLGRLIAPRIDFNIWQIQMKAILTQVGVRKALGTRPDGMTDDKWEDLDQKALSAMQLSLSTDVLREVINETSVFSLWKKLEALYMKKSLANKLRLKKRLSTIRMAEGTSIRSHLNEFNSLIIDLEKLDVKIDDEDKAILLVVSLPATFKHFKEIMIYDLFKRVILLDQSPDLNQEIDWFSTYDSVDTGEVVIDDGSTLEIAGIGSVQIKTHDGIVRTLSNVRHVPRMKRNLISLGTLESLGYKYVGDNGVLKISKGNLVVLKGNRIDSLYFLQGSKVTVVIGDGSPLEIAGIGSMQIKTHDGIVRTLSNVRHVPRMKRNLISLGTLESLGYKYKRVSFSTATHQTEGILDYVHSDLWGKSKFRSLGGCLWNKRALWAETISTTSYLINRSPNSAINFQIPEEVWSVPLLQNKLLVLHLLVTMIIVLLETDLEGMLLFLIDIVTLMSLIDQLKAQLSHEFEMKDLGPAKKILGMEIQPDRKCPINEDGKDYMSRVPYASAVGNLMYAMIYTRPDLAHAVSVVSRFMHNPGKEHWNSVKWILRYLKVGKLSLQSVTALSTTKAEYISATEGVKEAIWLRGLVSELGIRQGQVTVGKIHIENNPADMLTKSLSNTKFKHCLDLVDDTEASGDIIYSTSAIVGHGAGKTTLPQYVYNDKRVVDRFDVRMWICISRKLDVHRHTTEDQGVVESATMKNQGVQFPNLNNLNNLHCALRGVLQESQRFLLVLDDVWFDNFQDEEEWAKLLAPLVSQHPRSQVLVTCRSRRLPAPLRCKQVFPLQNMEDTDFLALFKYLAFAGEQQHKHEKLQDFAGRIAQKLCKSPLAAKVVGSQLSRNMNVSAWEDSLKSDNLGEPRGALLWSYQNLDPNIQRCFMYCSLFRKGHMYEVAELVHLWVAKGFVADSSNQSRTLLEDIGRVYFRELVHASFFQEVCTNSKNTSYYMHDTIHDLAEALSRGDCFRLFEDGIREIPHTVRHLSVYVDTMDHHKQSICRLIHLRTVICMEPVMDDANKLFHEVLRNQKKLRILLLCFHNSSKLPQSIGEFKHLRYLNIHKTSISELPGELCTLYHLQFLRVHQDVKNLQIKLRHLERCARSRSSSGFIGQLPVPQIPYIGKLTTVQRLLEFLVAKQKGHEVQQLRDMRELSFTLNILNLENVRTKDEVQEAMLHDKGRLHSLHLGWSCTDDYMDNSLHLDVLEGLKPPHELSIEGYRSPTYPSWLFEDSHLVNLRSLYLSSCTALENLPSMVQPVKQFIRISLHNIPNLKTPLLIPGGLESLDIMGCPLLRFVSSEELGKHEQHINLLKAGNLSSKLSMMWETERGSQIYRYNIRDTLKSEYSSLEQLMALMDDDISVQLRTMKNASESERDEVLVQEDTMKAWLYCQEQRIKLIYARPTENLLFLPSSLRLFTLSSCSLTDGALAVCLQGLTSLYGLRIEKIMSLTSLPSSEVMQCLTALQTLYIRSCWCIRSLGGLRKVTSLSRVTIDSCVSLELVDGNEIDTIPSFIEKLSISGCVLGADFLTTEFPRLRSISITSCRSSSSFSIGHLHSLESLSLNNMPDLCFLEGLSCPHLQDIHLINVPKLTAQSFSQHHAWTSLAISSSAMLSLILSTDNIMLPEKLCFEQYNEPSITFEISAKFASIKFLEFSNSEVMSLPSSLRNMSCLEGIKFIKCPDLSSLPDLPLSVQKMEIQDCECLKISCQAPNGENWPKIEHIRWEADRVFQTQRKHNVVQYTGMIEMETWNSCLPKKLQPGQSVSWSAKMGYSWFESPSPGMSVPGSVPMGFKIADICKWLTEISKTLIDVAGKIPAKWLTEISKTLIDVAAKLQALVFNLGLVRLAGRMLPGAKKRNMIN
uniref:Reverse transcriptase zinc-binding domain-containing protein n=1 Tax=Oryza brachyantha TaxID=4533 RepID=J3N766_ORYBR